MEVLNKPERRTSFLIFLLFFIITMGIILVAVYFDFYIPKKELAHLRAENHKMQTEFDFQAKFADKLEEVKSFTDSLGVKGQDFYYNQQLANDGIIDLQKMVPPGDSLVRNNMYDNMVLAYRQLVQEKKTINLLGGSKDEVDHLLQQIETYKKELEIVKRDLEVCRQINRGN